MSHKHHIIPKHMGGTNESSNLIELTVEEHAQAHLELYNTHGKYEDWYAYLALSGQITSDEARRAICKQRMLDNNPMKNPESVKKAQKARAGYVTSEATKQKLSVALKGTKKITTINMNQSKAKNYIVTTPAGEIIQVTNLKKFCKEHNLTEGLLYKVASGNRNHHRKYKCVKVADLSPDSVFQ